MVRRRVGTAIPLLAFALAGHRVAERVAAFRTRARTPRITAGLLMIALALALTFDVTTALQRARPDYTAAAQRKVEDNDIARQELSGPSSVPGRVLRAAPGPPSTPSPRQA